MRESPPTGIFGPVASRRLGRSLGIDLVTPGTCSFDCVYCECGKTVALEIERRTYEDVDHILAYLDCILAEHPALDVLTFAGSGEPTLSLSLGSVIQHLKEHTSYPVAVLTNGSLLGQPDVQEELRPIDLLIPTLTTAHEETFRRIHRPHPSLKLSSILEGMVTFRRECPVEMWLEVFLVPGVNTSVLELTGIVIGSPASNPIVSRSTPGTDPPQNHGYSRRIPARSRRQRRSWKRPGCRLRSSAPVLPGPTPVPGNGSVLP